MCVDVVAGNIWQAVPPPPPVSPLITLRKDSVTTLKASSAALDRARSGCSALASSRYRALYPSRRELKLKHRFQLHQM